MGAARPSAQPAHGGPGLASRSGIILRIACNSFGNRTWERRAGRFVCLTGRPANESPRMPGRQAPVDPEPPSPRRPGPLKPISNAKLQGPSQSAALFSIEAPSERLALAPEQSGVLFSRLSALGFLNPTHVRAAHCAPIGMKGRQATAGQRSEEIGNADDQQTTGSNKQNFEANNARQHGGAISERPRGMQRALAGFWVT
jgi:hypothetical protein